MDPKKSQKDLGRGSALPRVKISRRYISSPEVSNLIEVEGDIIEKGQSKKRKHGTILNPENAESVLSSTFNLPAFCFALIEDSALVYDPPSLFKIMTACVIDQTIIPFTSASSRHLKALGLTFTYDLVFDAEKLALANASNSPANTTLQRESLNAVKKHFNVSKEFGCRCVIDQYLLAAVVYAQALVDGDPQLKAQLVRRHLVKEPHVAVFKEVQIPRTKITCDNASFTFHGYLDYATGFIHAKDIPSLGRGSLKLDPSNALSGIVEAKSLSEMQDAVPQITMQVLTILTLTGRTSFTGALTNGALWRFFTAHDGGNEIRIYTSQEFASDTDNGVIVELLKDMIVYPMSPMIITDFNEVMTFE